jgi:hypothetical protein
MKNMKKFTYKMITPSLAQTIMEWADEMGVDYDIWNIEECFLGNSNEVEFGLHDWDFWENR